MEIFIQQVLNALSVASITILIAVGITLIFGLTGIINFAHGEFLMLGGMATWVAMQAGTSFWVAMVIAIVLVGAVGFLLERAVFRFTLDRPLNGFIVSLGLIILIQHVVIFFLDPTQKAIPRPLTTVWDVGEIRVAAMRVLVIGVTTAVVVVAFYLIARTRHGRALRASAADRDTAALMGIPVSLYISAVFVIGSMLAGLGGAMLIALFPITPFTGGAVVIKGFAIALIGGLGNPAGAVVAGLALGFVEGFSAGYGFSEWTGAFAFGLMIIILLVRPQGLLGGTEGPRGLT